MYIKTDAGTVHVDPSLTVNLAEQLKESLKDIIEGAAEDILLYTSTITARITLAMSFNEEVREKFFAESKVQLLLLAEINRIRIAKESEKLLIAVIDTMQRTLVGALTKVLAVTAVA